jgi:hypothetical protein
MDNRTKDIFREIEKLVINERERVNKIHEPFHSRHESFGIMKEELEEANEELDDVKTGILEDYWKLCRDSKEKKYGCKEALTLLGSLIYGIKYGILELIQLLVVIQKAENLELALELSELKKDLDLKEEDGGDK